MQKHLVSVLAFMVVAFAIQGLSHFAINARFYGSLGIMRPEPVMALGFATMIVQGAVISRALEVWRGADATLADGMRVSVAFGLMMVNYVVLTTPAKYATPDTAQWMLVEGLAGIAQFGLFGLALGAIHQRFGRIATRIAGARAL
jgi:hypothetical protein